MTATRLDGTVDAWRVTMVVRTRDRHVLHGSEAAAVDRVLTADQTRVCELMTVEELAGVGRVAVVATTDRVTVEVTGTDDEAAAVDAAHDRVLKRYARHDVVSVRPLAVEAARTTRAVRDVQVTGDYL